jgi:cyclic beta-1,2-glucan synthetase
VDRRGAARVRGGPRGNALGQPGLWASGVSGDLPILVVRTVRPEDVSLVLQILRAQEYWRLKGLSADVVILNDHPESYLDEVHEQLQGLLEKGPWAAWKHRPGGVYLLRGNGVAEADRTVLLAAARAVLERRGRRSDEPVGPPLPRSDLAGHASGAHGRGLGDRSTRS